MIVGSACLVELPVVDIALLCCSKGVRSIKGEGVVPFKYGAGIYGTEINHVSALLEVFNNVGVLCLYFAVGRFAEEKRIAAATAKHRVLASVTLQGVTPFFALQKIIAFASEELVAARAAVELVVVLPAIELVVAIDALAMSDCISHL